ncbi:MAG: TadE/TadG family type IV pilus assembly protein [Ilumatobacteraceae bacterium]
MTRLRDRGEANALGLVLIAPAAVALAVLILWIGRQVDTDAQMQAASSAAAHAAALQRTPGAAVAAARSTAMAMLNDAKACSGGPLVTIDTTAFHPGGTITVVVTCAPEHADLALVSPPPATFTATATAAIDTYRAVGLP